VFSFTNCYTYRMTLKQLKQAIEAARQTAIACQEHFDTQTAERWYATQMAYDQVLNLLAEYESHLTLPASPQQPPASTG
jgi:hypothetical protein